MNLEERRGLVRRFLNKCVDYADDSIARKKTRGEGEEEIAPWITYREFTKHAAMEVSNGDLDDWLEEE